VKYALALCALLASPLAFSEVLVAKATFDQYWQNTAWGNGFVLSYQLASVPVYASIGEDILLETQALPDQSYTWNVTSPSRLHYLQKGLQTAGDDFWFLQGSTAIQLNRDRCVTGTSTDCPYGPFHPDLSINGKFDLSEVTLTRLEITLGPASGPTGPYGQTRVGSLSFYADPASSVPEPSTAAVFALGALALAVFTKAQKSRSRS
jgi:hypothetical protein